MSENTQTHAHTHTHKKCTVWHSARDSETWCCRLILFDLPDLVFRVNTCLHSGAELQLSFTYVTGIFHKLKKTQNTLKVVACVSDLCVSPRGHVSYLEVCVALSDVSRKCSCVSVTSSPLRLTVTNGKPFCDVQELIISDTFGCCVDTSTWDRDRDPESVQSSATFIVSSEMQPGLHLSVLIWQSLRE